MEKLLLFVFKIGILLSATIEVPVLYLEPSGHFLEVGSALSGNCSSSNWESVDTDLRLGKYPCSYTGYSSLESYLTSLPTLNQSGFMTSGSPLTFRLESAGLKAYHIICGRGKEEKCLSKVSYNISITENQQTLSCLIRFTRDETGDYYHYPKDVTWLRNSHQIGDTIKIERSDLDDENETLSYTAQYKLTGDSSTETGDDSNTKSDAQALGGIYTCQYTSGSQQMRSEYKKVGNVSIKITTEPKEEQYTDGDNVVIYCKVTGYPTPNITWLFNNQMLSDDKFTNKNEAYGLLSILNLTDIDDKVDRGEYTCIAQNEVSTVTKMMKLHVRDALAPLWPFLGILVQVVVLIVAILLGERIRKKKIDNKSRLRAETLTSCPDTADS